MNTARVATKTRLFIGIPLPDKAKAAISKSLLAYKPYIERQVPPENWHMTFAFLGEVENWEHHISPLAEPMPQLFVPAISLTHVGPGLHQRKLWAYAAASPSLQRLHTSLQERVQQSGLGRPQDSGERPFVPHVQVASLATTGPYLGWPDNPVTATFTIHELTVFESDLSGEVAQYIPRATIKVTA